MAGQDETPGSRRRQSPEDLGSFLRRPGRPLPPAIGVDDVVRRIVELHEGDAGCTFNTYYGHVTGTRLYAVSVYPERGRVVPGRSLDPHVVRTPSIGGIMSALQTVTTSVIVDGILPGDPPMLAWHKWLRGTAGRQKDHTQWVQIRDAGLLASLREQAQVGEEIEVTIATDRTVEGAPSYLVGFVLPEHMTEKPATMRIAIDGPSASGKSAVGSRVAARLDYPFVDTGSMYRAITWLALRCGVNPENAAGLAALAEPARLEIGPPPMDGRETCSISVNGVDITRALRDTDVERNVSQVSAVPAVRAVMVRLQRDAAPANVVMAGRDIGTVVLPDAELKVYFAASVDVRAVRRQVELAEKGRVETLDQVRADLQRRDAIDSSRATSPLRPAEDAVTIDTDALTIDEVVERVLRLAVERGATLPEGGGQIRSAPTEPARPEAGRTR